MVYTVRMQAEGARGYWSRLGGMLGGTLFERAHYLAVDLPYDRRAARRWVPWPLRLAPAPATLFLAWFPTTSFGSTYREAGLFLWVRRAGRGDAIFCPWMIVDDDVAMITGREILGYPKKLGAIELAIDGDRVSGAATRRGAPLVAMRGRLGEELASPPPMLGVPHRNVRGAMGSVVSTVVAFTPRERVVSVRRADLEVEIGGSARDPLHELGLGAPLAGRLHVVDLQAGVPPIPVGVISPLAHVRQWLLRAH